MMSEMTKINEAALENVIGGTYAENMELTGAFGIVCGVNVAALTHHLYQKCEVFADLRKSNNTRTANVYYDTDSNAPLTHAEVMARIKAYNDSRR